VNCIVLPQIRVQRQDSVIIVMNLQETAKLILCTRDCVSLLYNEMK
jgi:hypothetical protein